MRFAGLEEHIATVVQAVCFAAIAPIDGDVFLAGADDVALVKHVPDARAALRHQQLRPRQRRRPRPLKEFVPTRAVHAIARAYCAGVTRMTCLK